MAANVKTCCHPVTCIWRKLLAHLYSFVSSWLRMEQFLKPLFGSKGVSTEFLVWKSLATLFK